MVTAKAIYKAFHQAKPCRPSMAEFLYICSYLDVSPKEFFDEDINHPVKSHELNELIKDMSSDDLELLISLTRRIKDL